MTEDEAKGWLFDAVDVSRETYDKLDALRRLILDEAAHQNLISAGTVDHFWARHIVDGAQLVRWGPETDWLDIGSGAGLPGLVIAVITRRPVLLVEPRRRRADFLAGAIKALGLNCEVAALPIAKVPPRKVGAITARAVAPLPDLLEMGLRFANSSTVWLLPKGRRAAAELAALDKSWQGDFSTHPSVTDPESQIIIARNVSRKDTHR